MDAAGLLDSREPWTELTLPGEPPATFRFTAGETVHVRADSEAGALYRSLDAPSGDARLRWAWRVDSAFAATDAADTDRDDRAVAVHLWFDTGDEGATLYGGMAEFFGYPQVTHAITYVWGGVRKRETWLRNPYFERGMLAVLRGPDAPRETWLRERRTLAADIERAFGNAVTRADLAHIAVSADTDNTNQAAKAAVRGLRVHAPGEG